MRKIRKILSRVLLILLSIIVIIPFRINVSAARTVGEFYFKRNETKKIALTFDDGPHPRYTRQILNILDKYGIKATFFVIGVNALNYKDTLKEVAAAGHEIGNHTNSHDCIKSKGIEKIRLEVTECQNIIYDICGQKTRLFRPPGGLIDKECIMGSDVFDGYNIIYWSIDTKDWAHCSSDSISDYVTTNIRSGDIILMHDYIGRNSPTPNALEIMIPRLLDMGYEFVTVGELIGQD